MGSKTAHTSMSKRTTITLPDSVFEEIEDWASQQGRPTAGLMALLIELQLREAKKTGEFVPSKQDTTAK